MDAVEAGVEASKRVVVLVALDISSNPSGSAPFGRLIVRSIPTRSWSRPVGSRVSQAAPAGGPPVGADRAEGGQAGRGITLEGDGLDPVAGDEEISW